MCNFLRTVSFLLTWSSAYAEFSFDNLAANFGTNGRWSSAECPETVQNFFLPRTNISCPWTGTLLFWRSLLRMFDDGPLFFSADCPKMKRKSNFFLIYFPQVSPMDKCNASLTIVTKKPCMKAGKCSLIVRKRYEILISWKQKIFPNMFLGTRRLQFRQQLKKLRQQAGKVCSTPKNDRRSTLF